MASSLLSGVSRRSFLRVTAAGAAMTSLSGWIDVLAAKAAATGAKHKSCILLWMEGGPSHKDTFDMKPGTENGGEFKPIATSVPGIRISEHFPKFAQRLEHAAILRGMCTSEGAHGRAKYFMHTGYPRAWSSVLIGGGIKGGQVVGKTDEEGATVIDRPISGLDFLATVCQTLGIDYSKQNQTSIGRPVRIVDKGANPITELLA